MNKRLQGGAWRITGRNINMVWQAGGGRASGPIVATHRHATFRRQSGDQPNTAESVSETGLCA